MPVRTTRTVAWVATGTGTSMQHQDISTVCGTKALIYAGAHHTDCRVRGRSRRASQRRRMWGESTGTGTSM
jgi:hypothetical protein